MGMEREGSLEEAIAVKLGLKKPPDINVEEYYPTYLNMAKNFMEGIFFRNKGLEGRTVLLWKLIYSPLFYLQNEVFYRRLDKREEMINDKFANMLEIRSKHVRASS